MLLISCMFLFFYSDVLKISAFGVFFAVLTGIFVFIILFMVFWAFWAFWVFLKPWVTLRLIRYETLKVICSAIFFPLIFRLFFIIFPTFRPIIRGERQGNRIIQQGAEQSVQSFEMSRSMSPKIIHISQYFQNRRQGLELEAVEAASKYQNFTKCKN